MITHQWQKYIVKAYLLLVKLSISYILDLANNAKILKINFLWVGNIAFGS
jgi:hypothetical protein